MNLKEEFEKAFEEQAIEANAYPIIRFDMALWAARWMAERCANILDTHENANDKIANETEQTPVEKFMDARTRSDMTASFASIGMECAYIADEIRQLAKELQ